MPMSELARAWHLHYLASQVIDETMRLLIVASPELINRLEAYQKALDYERAERVAENAPLN